MRQSTVRRFCIFFILILAIQYSKGDQYHDYKKQVKRFQNNDQQKPLVLHRSKRSASLIYNGIMFAAMVLSLGVDIYFHIRECCDVQPDACTNGDKYKHLKDTFVNNSIEYERQYIAAKNLDENIEMLGGHMARLWLRIEGFEDQLTMLLSAADGDFEASLAAAEAAILNNTENYANFDEIDLVFESQFKDSLSTFYRMQGFVSWALLERIKLFVQKEIADAASLFITRNTASLSTNIEIPTTSVFSSLKTRFLNLQAVQDIQTWMANNPKQVAFFKHAGYIIFTLAFVGYEAFRVIERINDCKEIKDQSQEAIDEIEKAQDELDIYQADLDVLHRNLTENYESMKNQLSSEYFLAYVNYTKSILQNSSSDYSGATSDIEKIDNFLTNINSDNTAVIESITKDLEEAFGNIVFLLGCSTSQLNIINDAKSQCSKGTFSLESIVETKLKLQDTYNCTGWITLLEEETLTDLLSSLMTDEGYKTNCYLNSESIISDICLKKKVGEDVTKIFTTYGDKLSNNEITYVMSNCDKVSLTDFVKVEICDSKEVGKTLSAMVEKYESYIESEIEETYNSCELSEKKTEDICELKEKKYDVEYVQQYFSLYPSDKVETVYNACVVASLPDLPDNWKRMICFLTSSMTNDQIVKDNLFVGYNSESVYAALENC